MAKWTTILFVIFPFLVLAQVELKNSSLTNPELRLLYEGVENVLVVEGVINLVDLKVTAVNSEVCFINEANSNRFIVKPGHADFDTLSVFLGDSLLIEEVFAVHRIGNLVARLGNLTDSLVMVNEVLINSTLKAVIPECHYNHGIRIHSFDLAILNDGDTLFPYRKELPISVDTVWVENPDTGFLEFELRPNTLPNFTTKSNKLTEEQRRIIGSLDAGARLSFTNIKGACPSCSVLLFAPFNLTIE